LLYSRLLRRRRRRIGLESVETGATVATVAPPGPASPIEPVHAATSSSAPRPVVGRRNIARISGGRFAPANSGSGRTQSPGEVRCDELSRGSSWHRRDRLAGKRVHACVSACDRSVQAPNAQRACERPPASSFCPIDEMPKMWDVRRRLGACRFVPRTLRFRIRVSRARPWAPRGRTRAWPCVRRNGSWRAGHDQCTGPASRPTPEGWPAD
jgi:hypothetical protein